MSDYDGGPAFPFTPTDKSGQIGPAYEGMSLRDWFAGMALQGEVASPDSGTLEADSITFSELADDCYRMADAMLAARVKEDA